MIRSGDTGFIDRVSGGGYHPERVVGWAAVPSLLSSRAVGSPPHQTGVTLSLEAAG
jgi:hypothetical protein